VGVILVAFALTLTGGLLIGLRIFQEVSGLLLMNLALTAAGIYAVRALYFSVMKEARIPVNLTGTAVGMVSFAGFAPEIFISPWMGHLLDRSPGAAGHADVFLLLSAFAFTGLVAAWLFYRLARH